MNEFKKEILSAFHKQNQFTSHALKGDDMEDNVIAEIRRIKDELASVYGYDVRKILNNAIIKQKESGYTTVNLREKKQDNEYASRTAHDGCIENICGIK